jgi:hypothetical protein
MKFQVTVIESERGWGQKIDEVREFNSADKAWKFYDEVNSRNTERTAPDIYWQAQPPVRIE